MKKIVNTQKEFLERKNIWNKKYMGLTTYWGRKCHPTQVFLPGKFHGQRSLAGYVQSVDLQRVVYNWATERNTLKRKRKITELEYVITETTKKCSRMRKRKMSRV